MSVSPTLFPPLSLNEMKARIDAILAEDPANGDLQCLFSSGYLNEDRELCDWSTQCIVDVHVINEVDPHEEPDLDEDGEEDPDWERTVTDVYVCFMTYKDD